MHVEHSIAFVPHPLKHSPHGYFEAMIPGSNDTVMINSIRKPQFRSEYVKLVCKQADRRPECLTNQTDGAAVEH